MIHKAAIEAAAITWPNGNRVQLYLSHNRNTGERIVWQHVRGRRPSRITGRNLSKLADELRAVEANGEGRIDVFNDAAWGVLRNG